MSEKELWISKICMSPNKEWNRKNRSCIDIDNLNKYVTFYPLSNITPPICFNRLFSLHFLDKKSVHNRIRQRGCAVNLTLQRIYVPIWTQSNDTELWLRIYHYWFIYHLHWKGNCRHRIKIQKSMFRLFAYKINELRYSERQNSEFWNFLSCKQN